MTSKDNRVKPIHITFLLFTGWALGILTAVILYGLFK